MARAWHPDITLQLIYLLIQQKKDITYNATTYYSLELIRRNASLAKSFRRILPAAFCGMESTRKNMVDSLVVHNLHDKL